MIQPATASPSPPDRGAQPRRADTTQAFAQAFASFADPGDDDAPPVAAEPGNDDPAADGKPLPDAPASAPAPTLAWLAHLTPPAPPVAETPAAAPPVALAPPVMLPPAPALVAPIGEAAVAAVAEPLTDGTTDGAALEAAATPVADAPPPPDPKASFVLPAVPDAAPNTAAPAAAVFGAAIRAATGTDDEAKPRRESVDTGPLPIGAVGLEPQRHAVLAAGDVQQAPLDTRQGDFAHRMVDRIEQLRDDANANDTRIRLIPDALGRIDVTMRRDGDAVHVHFAAEQAATRTLLDDARPRLLDIAASRGLALGQTSVGSGGGGDAQQRPQTPTPSWQPPRAATPATTASITTDDIRIA